MVFNTRAEFLYILPAAYATYAYLYSELNINIASMWPTSTCHSAIIGKEKFNTMDSLKGKRVRVWEAQQVNSLRALDVVGTVVPQNDIYLAFKTGMIDAIVHRSEEHTSELQSLMRISYAVFCLKKKTNTKQKQ